MKATWLAWGTVVLLGTACAPSGAMITYLDFGKDAADVQVVADTSPEVDALPLPDLSLPEETGTETSVETAAETAADLVLPDVVPDVPEVECEPGTGCPMELCLENLDCQSGWCVDHLGEGVCTMTCTDNCPKGMSCEKVLGDGPTEEFVCLSHHPTLCRPCIESVDCQSAAGQVGACIDYGDTGSFCGSPCGEEEQCPEGFSCEPATTVEGYGMQQCIADAGVCSCTEKAISLSLSTDCETSNEWGTCEGTRECLEGGLTECSAPVPDRDLCNGLDDDCDGETDEEACDDGNPCTNDSCSGEAGCGYVPLDEAACSDEDPCTYEDHCQGGECVGILLECEDENPCTDDWCNENGECKSEPNQEPCDDGDPCSVSDMCSQGECEGSKLPCDCLADQDCDELEDGDMCNGTLYCDVMELPYKCVTDPDTVVDCPAPEGPDAFCLAVACDPASGKCFTLPDHEGLPCNDGDLCSLEDTCLQGACAGGKELDCSDGNPCTDDLCSPEEGCVNEYNTAPCDDGNICTFGDACSEGDCVSGPLLQCDDENPCTNDFCHPVSGCQHDNNQEFCPDGKCKNGECLPLGPEDCDDNNSCTTDTFDADLGCIYSINDNPCSDNNVCTFGDHCQWGVCVFDDVLDCDDGDICTNDYCDPKLGCMNPFNNEPCDDFDPCTVDDVCTAGACQGIGPNACDDENPRTDDLCDPILGCYQLDNNGPCDDGDVCTSGDTCNEGVCLGLDELVCEDENPCTDDACDQAVGCVFVFNDNPCDDEDDCTTADTCVNGECAGLKQMDCDDQNPCTDDWCDPPNGCIYTFNNLPCDDQNICTVEDKCFNGSCQGIEEGACVDMNECTDDLCDPVAGCVFIPNDGPCPGGHCEEGQCIPDCGADCCMPVFFRDDFGQDKGWEYGPEWGRGAAQASAGHGYGGPDPGADHTESADNFVAGVNIGGNAGTVLHDFYWLTSPPISTLGATSLHLTYRRWLNSDYLPYMQNRVEVHNGSQWFVIWESGGSPGIQDNSWSFHNYDVTEFSNAQFRVRFGFDIGAGGVFAVSGWNVDDVAVFEFPGVDSTPLCCQWPSDCLGIYPSPVTCSDGACKML